MSLLGPDRRTYYDMNPWYLTNKANQGSYWYQHVLEVNKVLLEKLIIFITEDN